MCIMKVDKSTTTINNYYNADPRIEAKLDLIIQNQQKMATEFSQLKTDFEELKAAITTERQQILDKLAAAEAKAATLEADLAKAGTEEERAALHAGMREAIQVVKDIVPDPATEPPAEGTV